MALPKGMETRYIFLKSFYEKVDKKNFREFLGRCKLFLSTTNKLIQRESKRVNRKMCQGMFQEIAVLMKKIEQKFKNKNRKSLSLVNCESAFRDRISTSIIVNHEHKNLERFLSDARFKILELIKMKLRSCSEKLDIVSYSAAYAIPPRNSYSVVHRDLPGDIRVHAR